MNKVIYLTVILLLVAVLFIPSFVEYIFFIPFEGRIPEMTNSIVSSVRWIKAYNE